MTDQELLKLAANAAGYKLAKTIHEYTDGTQRVTSYCCFYEGGASADWDPLKYDGDALRLAVKLGIYFLVVTEEGEVSARIRNGARTSWREPIERDPYAATRRAIVRAAAEIGKEMK